MSKDNVSQKVILVVDDDEIFRETLCSGLEAAYTVMSAANGKEAMAIVNRAKVDLILTDARMPGMSGYELIEWINLHLNRAIPYIVMTGYLSLAENTDEKLHTYKTVTKPFKLADMKRVIESRLNQSEEEENEDISEIRFCQVPISDIVLRPVLDFDIYLQLSEQNFVKVAYKDEELPLAQIKKFKQKGVNHLYIRKEDFSKFVQFTFDLAKSVSSHPSISPAKKIAFLDHAHKVIMGNIFKEGLDQQSYEATADFVSLSVGTVLESHEVLDLLEVLKDLGQNVYTDSYAAALYSVMIAREMNYESALTAFKLCIAGVFQDIGKKEIDSEIVEKNETDLTKKQQQVLESHVVRSQKILESLKCIHSDIIRLIQEHHEDLEGKGYPFGKKRPEQHPLSRILQCSNVFIERINLKKNEEAKVDVAAVLSDMEKSYKNRIDAECIKALRSLFKIPAVGAEV
ncbi:MAG: hypothetical protein K0R29_1174 [Pseudobdellovibrio sp.]|jgi:response regulator RpfG family c-di-GMP phosphodiesterase|nr:hypothetical protein [Pseudobdellovibrio sp.]